MLVATKLNGVKAYKIVILMLVTKTRTTLIYSSVQLSQYLRVQY